MWWLYIRLRGCLFQPTGTYSSKRVLLSIYFVDGLERSRPIQVRRSVLWNETTHARIGAAVQSMRGVCVGFFLTKRLHAESALG